MKRALVLAAVLAAGAFGQWSAKHVGSFAVATLKDEAIERRLRERFKASGSPVFLMGAPGSGLQQGDIVRFADKAVMVDADVWQTLASEGALRALKQAPLVRVKAGADPAAWGARARLVPNTRERRLYEFGAALLKTLEESMGSAPDGQKLFLSFEAGQMVLVAPGSFMDRLRSGAGDAGAAKERSAKGRPRFVNPPPSDSVAVRSGLDWTAWAVDDSGGPTAGYRYRLEGELPPGLTWNESSHRLHGVCSMEGRWRLTFRVSDASGASDTLVWNLRVAGEPTRKRKADQATDPFVSGIELPWDTLVESRWYGWDLAEQVERWRRAGTTLDSVDGFGAEARWNGTELSVRPRRPGTATVKFWFHRGGDSVQVERKCPVKPHPLPVFLSRNGGSGVLEGDSRVYRPLATDAYGGPVSIEAEFSRDAPMEWDGAQLRVSPKGPGAWSVRFVARDTLDHTVEQWVTFRSEAKLTSRRGLETRVVAGTNPWSVWMEFGRGRFSLFTPDPVRLGEFRDPVRRDWPFLLLGANLLGAESIRRGNAFSIDLGGTLRLPAMAVLTGGVAGRVLARADCRPALPWVFEGEFMGWVHQAIVATDTARLRSIIEAENDESGLDAFKERYGRVLGQVMSDAFDRRNGVFLTRVEGWLQLPAKFAVGAGIWREDLPVGMIMDQRLSSGVRWSPSGRFGSLEATVRGGWGPGDAGAATWFDLRWASGILP